jgi:hypothetical protein
MSNPFTTTSATGGDNLVTLAQVKTYGQLSGSTYDTTLAQLISAASRAVEGYCDRYFIAETDRTEYHNGPDGGSTNGMGQFICLQLYPVTSSPRVRFAYPCLEVSNTDSDTYEATVKIDSGVMTLTRNGSSSTLTLSSYASITLLAAAIVALGNGWTASVLNRHENFPASRIRGGMGVFDALESSATFELFVIAPHRLRVNTHTGSLYGAYYPSGFQCIEVTYNGGYTVIPDDVVSACCDLTLALFRLSNRESSGLLKSETLGDYRWEAFPMNNASVVASQMGNLSPVAVQLLAPYKRIRAL